MGKIIRNTVERAAGEVRKQRERLAQLTAEKAAAESEAAALQRRAGEEVAADESGTAATRLARSLGDMRTQVEILGQAIAAQEPRVKAAEAAYLEAEAEEAEKPLAAAQAALSRHQAKTSALLKELEEHEGRFISEMEHLDELRFQRRPTVEITPGMPGTIVGGTVEYKAPKSFALQAAVEDAQRSVDILRALAEGREPKVDLGLEGRRTLADVYPACVWGPQALVPAPAYLRAVESAQERLASLDREESSLEERLANVAAQSAAHEEAAHGPADQRRLPGGWREGDDPGKEPAVPPRRVMGETGIRHKLATLPKRREEAQRQLAALTGEANDPADADTAAAS